MPISLQRKSIFQLAYRKRILLFPHLRESLVSTRSNDIYNVDVPLVASDQDYGDNITGLIDNNTLSSKEFLHTAIILKGLGLTAKALSDQSSDQNLKLINLLLDSQEEITRLRNDLMESQQQQAALLVQVQTLTVEMATASAKRDSLELSKRAQKEKKRTRKRKPLKDPFEEIDLVNVLKKIKDRFTDQLIRSRYCVCLTLLYVFGIRVNELRQIKIAHLYTYLRGEPLRLQIGKSKIAAKVTFPSSKGTRDFLNKHCLDELQYLFAQPHGDSLVKCSREHLTRELNNVIKAYGFSVHKTLLSHSCRVSFITRICKTNGIEAARAMVGHANISTTQVYNRNYLTQRSQQKIFNDSLKDTGELFDTAEVEELLEETDFE